MSAVAAALRVSRAHLSITRRKPPKARGPYLKADDGVLVERIKAEAAERPTYGYRRMAARLTRARPSEPVNHKRAYRVMKVAGLLLPRYTGRVGRVHDGTVETTHSDMRWCSDAFEIRCWNGERVHVAFSLDCCDREAIAWVAGREHLIGADIKNLMALSIERRFGATTTPHRIEWLSDNGPPYTAYFTRLFGKVHGLDVCTTPAYSPESNGMAEAFVKTFKRDYVYLGDVTSAEAVLRQLPRWFADYNENHPHKGLKLLSPNQFRRAHAA